MTPNTIFWISALGILGATVGCAVAGWLAARHGDYPAHIRAMRTAASFIGVFLAGYVIKVIVLGREARELWPSWGHSLLYAHETAIAGMLVCGVLAWSSRSRKRSPAARHRRLGRTAVVCSIVALITGGGLIAAMSQSAPAIGTDTAEGRGDVPIAESTHGQHPGR